MVQQVVERYSLDLLTDIRQPVGVFLQHLEDVPVHWHDFYELVYVTGGRSVHTGNGRSHIVRAGSAMLLSPADFHGFQVLSPEPLTCYNVVIDPRVAERHLAGLLGSEKAAQPWVVDDLPVRADFDRLWSEAQHRRSGADRVIDALLACILVEFSRRLPPDDHVRPVGDDVIRRAVFYVDQHFREPLTLAQVAGSVFLSPNYFSERFHEATGIAFQAYLQQSRLRFARSLLAATDVPVTDAALAAGFNSASHFARAYRSRYGRPPSQDRPRRDEGR